MKIQHINGVATNPEELKGVGDVVRVDGEDFVVNEVNIYFDELAEVHNFSYKLERVAEKEYTREELLNL